MSTAIQDDRAKSRLNDRKIDGSEYKNVMNGGNYGYMTRSLEGLPIEYAMNFSTMGGNILPYANMRYTTKKDTLRKGKWTPEEELYTNKIIEAFNAGLLKLPENSSGVTLRSYLADKLGCDPMRITKKYTGASCLGKRVYHRETSSATAEAIERVQKELDALEAKFRTKMEQLRKERREHESAIDRMYISTPNIDAMFVPSPMQMGYGGSFSFPQFSNVNVTVPSQYYFQGLPSPGQQEPKNGKRKLSEMSSVSHSSDDDDSNSINDKTESSETKSSNPKGKSSLSNQNGSVLQMTGMLNPQHLAYIQMLANCGPYIKTEHSHSSEIQGRLASRDDYSGSDITDEEKADTDGSSQKNDELKSYLKIQDSLSKGTDPESDCVSSNDRDEYLLVIKGVHNSKPLSHKTQSVSVSSLTTISSSSCLKHPPSLEDDQAASSLLGFFNHLKNDSHEHLVEFVEDVQKTITSKSNPIRIPSAHTLNENGSHRKRRNSEVSFSDDRLSFD